MDHYAHCTLCPRACGQNRHLHAGFCGATDELRVARAALHRWEEPCISGTNGSGAVFFCGCPLHCVFCQNEEISGGGVGKAVSHARLGEIFLDLQHQGAQNINLVTAGHFAPDIVCAVRDAKSRGLHVPVIYNSGGYESADTLKLFLGTVDVYLPDFKFMDPALARRYARAENYGDVAKKALAEMFLQTGGIVFDDAGMVQRGMIVRHLVLPGGAEDSKRILSYLFETYGNRIFLSIMNQYTPAAKNLPAELRHPLAQKDYDAVLDFAVRIGVEQAFIQEEGTADMEYIPAFDGTGV